MDKLYQYEINEEILATKYIYPKEIVRMRNDLLSIINLYS